MKNSIRLLYVVVFMVLGGFMSVASAKCYEEVETPGGLDCADKSYSKSADFASQCKVEKGKTEKVEVDCPMSWYPVTKANNELTQAQFCSILGLKPGSFDGRVCASGENKPPASQEGSPSIAYWSGKTGGDGVGVKSELITQTITSGNCRDCEQTTTVVTNRYCWHNGQKKDMDGSDVLVAWVCE